MTATSLLWLIIIRPGPSESYHLEMQVFQGQGQGMPIARQEFAALKCPTVSYTDPTYV